MKESISKIMNKISEEVLKKIKEENIKPKSYWHFVTKNYCIWFLFGISIILGSFSFGMILFMFRQLDWDIYHYLGNSFLKTVFISLPYLWFVFFILFLSVAYYNFVHTKRGYRYRFIFILFISLAISAIFGTGLYFNGFSENLENIFSQKIPYYNKLVYTCESQWMYPEKGLLAGTITQLGISKNSFRLIDCKNQLWEVNIDNTIWKGKLEPLTGLRIKLIGKMEDASHFKAIEIRPWKGKGNLSK